VLLLLGLLIFYLLDGHLLENAFDFKIAVLNFFLQMLLQLQTYEVYRGEFCINEVQPLAAEVEVVLPFSHQDDTGHSYR
jgi:hypothetical protein